MLYSWGTELHSAARSWEHSSINCFHIPTPPELMPYKGNGYGQGKAGNRELRDAWHEQALSIKVKSSWWSPWAKIIVISHPFLPRRWFMSEIFQLFLKGKDRNSCCCRIIEFNVFPPFRPRFLTERENWQIFLAFGMYLCQFSVLWFQTNQNNKAGLWVPRWDTEEWHNCLCRMDELTSMSFNLLAMADVKHTYTRKYEIPL